MSKLTYEEFCEKMKMTVEMAPAEIALAKETHGIDILGEMEQARKKEYQLYLDGDFDK